MKRREFIRNVSISAAGTITLGNIPIKVLAGNHALKSAALASSNDNVLIFVQLHGGNDGLNTLIPVDQYNQYYEYRANIAIPDHGARQFINVDESIPVQDQIGLHPDMKDFKILYDEGKAVIVQNVGYPNMNGSHFRGRDLVFMGLDGNDDTLNVSSGWMGRFLDNEYPGYPDSYPTPSMPDPIAIEIGSAMSIAFNRENGIPIGLNVDSPEQFYNLINGVGVHNASFYRPDGHAGDELEYLWQFEGMSNVYASRLKDVYLAGSNSSVNYPEQYPLPAPTNFLYNPLSGQLKLIARLLKGGIKTRIFLVRLGGFDTHAAQVLSRDESTLGSHAALLYHLSSAIKAFQDDMSNLGVEDKVLTMTFTEFGRRVSSNLSLGTDHGTSTPVFLFGKGLESKIVGTNPDLSNLNNGNIIYNIDYRQIYTSVVQDWFGASNEAMQATGFTEWLNNRIDLFGSTSVNQYGTQDQKINCYPNPAHDQVQVKFWLLKPTAIKITILNTLGQKVKVINTGDLFFGDQKITVDISSLDAGNYILQIEGLNIKANTQLIKY
jgi:uncharacterized protein (DUF1501 family)